MAQAFCHADKYINEKLDVKFYLNHSKLFERYMSLYLRNEQFQALKYFRKFNLLSNSDLKISWESNEVDEIKALFFS